MQIHKQSSYFFIILYNNIKQHGRKQRVDIKNAGFIRPASTFLDIQLSNSRVKVIEEVIFNNFMDDQLDDLIEL